MRQFFPRVIVLCFVASFLGCAASSPTSRAIVYDRVAQASVEVLVSGRLEGSGWFADPQGYVVTAAHIMMLKPNQPLEILSPTLGRLPAELVAMDIGHDIALLRVTSDTKRLYPYLETADAIPAIGDDVFVYGTPMFRHGMVLHGRVARSQPSYEWLRSNSGYLRAIYIRGSAPHGSSGGCWVDQRGRVIGNQSSFMSHSNAQTGLIFVAPADAIAQLVATKQDVVVPTLNMAFEEMWEQSTDFIKRFPAGTEGLKPAVIAPDGVAAKAQITEEMVITAVNGQPMRYRDDMVRFLHSRKPGEELTLTIVQADGQPQREIKVEVAACELR